MLCYYTVKFSNDDGLARLRSIVGESYSDDKLRWLLLKVGGDVGRAVEYYYGHGDLNDDTMDDAGLPADAATIVPPATNPSLDPQAIASLKDLLDNNVTDAELRDLLTRSHGDLSDAVGLYFLDKTPGQDNPSKSPVVSITPPPTPTFSSPDGPHKVLHTNEEYEVELTDGVLKWTIGNVLGRIVVQDVVVGGAAHKANIQKADVLIACSGHVIKETNVAPIVTRLSKEVVNVPVLLRFRRADHTHGHHDDRKPSVDTSVVPTELLLSSSSSPVEYGIHIMARALESMRQAAADKYSSDLLLLHYVWSQGNVAVAMDQLFHPVPHFPNFDQVVGHEWYSTDGHVNNRAHPDWPLYDASFPTGPMGITVENIHERTIIVNVKDGTSAAYANVSVDSWLVAINGEGVTHLTHRETLHRIHTLPRPLLLTFCVTPAPWLPALKQTMDVNIRMAQSANPTERHELVVSDDDRTSFGRFQRKLLWVLQVLPSIACEILHVSALNATYNVVPADLLYTADVDGIDTTDGAVARRALMAMVHGMGLHADKGESVVLDLVRGLAVLAQWCAPNSATESHHQHLWWVLHLVLDVFENGSVMEKSTTWDAIVDSLKALGAALSPSAFLRTFPPLLARLSLYSSPSSRIIPLALLPLTYARVHGDLRVQFRGLFERLTMDDAPLVRRAAVFVLPSLARVAGPDAIAWVVQSAEKLSADHSDLVRLYAVQAVADLGDVLSGLDDPARRLVRCQLLPLVNSFVTDSDWQIRHQTVALVPTLLHVLGRDFADVLVDHYVELAGDANMEVRIAATRSAFPISAALSSSEKALDEDEAMHAKVALSILPALSSLSRDPCASVRRAVAASLGAALAMLRASQGDVLVPMIQQLIVDKDVVVAQTVVEQLATASAHLPDELEALVVVHVDKLSKQRPWRSRLLAAECVRHWTEHKTLPPSLVVVALSLLQDTVSQVRLGAVHALVQVTARHGPDWFQATGVGPVLSLLDQPFQLRLTGLEACRELAQRNLIPDPDALFDRVVEAATASKTGNIRVKALDVLVAMAPHLPPCTWDTVRPTLHASFGMEDDVEVQSRHVQLLAYVGSADEADMEPGSAM
ncbi:hypothetical protein DYB30_006696, partial [Aphanomyces astaci]